MRHLPTFARFSRAGMIGVACLVAGLAAGAGLMSTLAQPASTQLQACVANNTGVMRLVNAGATCYLNEHTVTWNAEGQQGLQGPPGAQGPIGPSNAYVIRQSGPVFGIPSPPVPPGVILLGGTSVLAFVAPETAPYLLTAQLDVDAEFGGRCQFEINDAVVGQGAAIPSSAGAVTIEIHDALNLNAGDFVNLACGNSILGMTVTNASLTALRVGQLNVTVIPPP